MGNHENDATENQLVYKSLREHGVKERTSDSCLIHSPFIRMNSVNNRLGLERVMFEGLVDHHDI